MIRIVDFRFLDNYKLYLKFSDGTRGEVDLTAEVSEPAFQALCDHDVFHNAHLDGGTVCWPDANIGFAPEWLYAKVHGLKVPNSYEEALENEQEMARG